MFPKFDVTPMPVETVDTSLTSWSSVIMMVGLTLALPLMVMAFNWFMEVEPFSPIARFFSKLGFGVLCLSSVSAILVLPFVLMNRAESAGGVWTMFIIFVMIAFVSRWLMKQSEVDDWTSWVIFGVFVVLCFIGAIVISLSLLIQSLIASVVLLPLGVILIVVIAFMSLANARTSF